MKGRGRKGLIQMWVVIATSPFNKSIFWFYRLFIVCSLCEFKKNGFIVLSMLITRNDVVKKKRKKKGKWWKQDDDAAIFKFIYKNKNVFTLLIHTLIYIVRLYILKQFYISFHCQKKIIFISWSIKFMQIDIIKCANIIWTRPRINKKIQK